MSCADEYRAGDHEGVWRRLTEAGPRLREDASVWQDAAEVAQETMRRVRANVQRLHAVLVEEGYRFEYPDEAFVSPPPDARARLDEAERVVGPLPLSLRAWLEAVGSVNFIGRHPQWRFEYTDALVVECPIDSIVREHEERKDMGWFRDQKTDRFPLYLAPDYMHKADVSGGEPLLDVVTRRRFRSAMGGRRPPRDHVYRVPAVSAPELGRISGLGAAGTPPGRRRPSHGRRAWPT